MPGRASEGAAAAEVADDRRDDAERYVGPQQRRPLLDVPLDVSVRQSAAPRLPARPLSWALKTTTPRPRRAERLDRLESGDDAEVPSKLPAPGTV